MLMLVQIPVASDRLDGTRKRSRFGTNNCPEGLAVLCYRFTAHSCVHLCTSATWIMLKWLEHVFLALGSPRKQLITLFCRGCSTFPNHKGRLQRDQKKRDEKNKKSRRQIKITFSCAFKAVCARMSSTWFGARSQTYICTWSRCYSQNSWVID